MRNPFHAHCAAVRPYGGPDWRWRRAVELAAGGPSAPDDPVTLTAARYLSGGDTPDVDAVRAAVGVRTAGGLRQRALEAYLLTRLSALRVAARTALTPAAVTAYAALFYPLREVGRPARAWRAIFLLGLDPLVDAARQGGARRVDARVRYERDDPALDPAEAVAFAHGDLRNEFLAGDPDTRRRAMTALARAAARRLDPGGR